MTNQITQQEFFNYVKQLPQLSEDKEQKTGTYKSSRIYGGDLAIIKELKSNDIFTTIMWITPEISENTYEGISITNEVKNKYHYFDLKTITLDQLKQTITNIHKLNSQEEVQSYLIELMEIYN